VGSGGGDWLRRARAALLEVGPSSVLSHDSAAKLWGLCLPVNESVIEVTVPHEERGDSRSSEQLAVSRARGLAQSARNRMEGLPLTTPARTLLDLAPRYNEQQLRKALDDAIVRRLLRPRDLMAVLDDPHLRSRPGSRKLRKALEPWLHSPKVESVAEMALLRVILAADIPAPVPQYKVLDGNRFVARVDFAWPALKVAVEMDGFRYHSSPAAQAGDLQRDATLIRLGWLELRTSPRQLETDPEAFLAALRALLAQRRATTTATS
jgi:hypothetical protein